VLQQARDAIAVHGAGAADFCRVVTERWGALVRDQRQGRAA